MKIKTLLLGLVTVLISCVYTYAEEPVATQSPYPEIENLNWVYASYGSEFLYNYGVKGSATMDGHDYLLLLQHPEFLEYGTHEQTIGIRKEDGVVYVYYPQQEMYPDRPACEYMLYDYNAEPGDEYTSVVNIANHTGDSMQVEATARVIATGKVNLFGKERVVQALALQYYTKEVEYFIIVEDLGVVHGPGVMAQPSYFGLTFSPTATLFSFLYLDSINDNNGLSYSRTDLGLSFTPQMIIDNLTWLYYSCDNESESIYHMGFGTEQIVEGQKYRCFYTKSSTSRRLSDGEVVSHQYDSPSERYWLLRETFGKIFMRECSGGIVSDEILLYDFTLQNGDAFRISNDNPPAGTVCINEPKAISYFPYDDRHRIGYRTDERKAYSLDDSYYEIIEIAGISGHNAGFLTSPPYLQRPTDDSVNPPSNCSLAMVYPGQNTVSPLYKTDVLEEKVKPFMELAGISLPSASTSSAVEYYNLQGVRIDNPAKGQTVIRRQAGRSEKIIIR